MTMRIRWQWLAGLLLAFLFVGCTGDADEQPGGEQDQSAHHDHLQVTEEQIEEAWTCPMHPDVLEDEPGSCPVCGMDLVAAEEMDGHDHGHDHDHDHDHDHSDSGANGEGGYTCPMHPQVHRDEPGSCPICGMDLVAVEEGHEHQDPDHSGDMEGMDVHVPSGVQQAMNIRTTTAGRDRLHRHVETFGRVRFDESGLRHYHPRADGWIEELEVDAVGDHVAEGERLYTLYSPDLVNAQEEYLQAVRRGNPQVIEAAEQRLAALDIQEPVIEEIRDSGEVIRFLPWYAEKDAEVTALGVREGMYVEPGTEILELADLETVWVEAQIHGGQSDWIGTGQHAEIGLAYRPGTREHAEITHLYPELDTVTRNLRARIAVDNPDTRFRPGMWTSVTIHAGDSDEHVFIPLEALIRTGRSARVVLREHDEHFVVREVQPGEVHGERVAILDGVEEGDVVVTSGHFLIDSEASLRGGHGRMEHDH